MKQVRPEHRGSKSPEDDEMRPEYNFDYGKSRPNRFAAGGAPVHRTVELDADVAEVFSTAESVNRALRALIAVVPGAKSAKIPSPRKAIKP